MPEADDRRAESQKGEMNISPAFVADAQSAELVEPAQGTLDHPTRFAQAAAVRLADLGQQVLDAEALEEEGVGFAAVSTITLHDVGTPPRATHFASNPLQGDKHRNKLSAVVDVGTGQSEAQGHAFGIGEKMMLAARFASVCRVRPRLSPPKTARTELESATARDQSIWSAAWRRARSSWWRRSQTPASCQSRSLRQQVMHVCGGRRCWQMQECQCPTQRWQRIGRVDRMRLRGLRQLCPVRIQRQRQMQVAWCG